MTREIYWILSAQVAWTVLFLAIFRFKELPIMVRVVTCAIYITCPVAVLVKGMASAIYAIDVIGPIVFLYYVMRSNLISRALRDRVFLLFLFLLIIVPAATGLILFSQEIYLTSIRGWKIAALWFYRNTVLLTLLGIGLSLKINREQGRRFIELNMGLGALLAVVGLVQYLTPINLSLLQIIFREADFDYGQSAGHGFMGLARNATGQWFASLAILGVGSFSIISKKFKPFALVAIVAGSIDILLSYSRAGVVGLTVGLAVLAVGRGIKAVVPIAFVGMIVYFVMGSEMVGERFALERGQQLGASAMSRIEGWELSLRYFGGNPQTMMLGIGATNQQAVARLTGIHGAHNEYVDVIWRGGIAMLVSLILALAFMFGRIWNLKKRARKKTRAVLWAILGLLAANCVMAVTQNHLIHTHATFAIGFFLYLAYGILVGARWTTPLYRNPRPSRGRPRERTGERHCPQNPPSPALPTP